MTDGTVQRLFFALWPEPALRRRLFRDIRQLVRRSGGRPVAEADLHVTVVFLGSTDAARRACCEAAAATLRPAPFTLTFDTVGYWPRARALWLGATQVPEPLPALARSLNEALAACGFIPEPRPLRPHVTLARKVAQWKGAQAPAPIPWPAETLCLVESVTDPAGARYRVLRRWPLAGG